MQLRIAAAGDIHAYEDDRERVHEAFRRLDGSADIVLLAGDLTTHGEPGQAAVLADACRLLDVPVLTVLGNHDCHAGRRDELVATLEDAGVQVLERSHAVVDVDGVRVGVVGCKGFVGGFPGSHLPDFGEPLLRRCYAETSDDVQALDRGLREVDFCQVRVVLLHYSPCAATLVGEPQGIWTMLGCDRLAGPVLEHEPDLVLHGHAHAGTFEAKIGMTPVYNVSVPVMGRDFWVFEVDAPVAATSRLH